MFSAEQLIHPAAGSILGPGAFPMAEMPGSRSNHGGFFVASTADRPVAKRGG
jgi:hypothetical protein